MRSFVGLGLLSAAKAAAGSLDKVEMVKMLGMANAAPEFTQAAQVGANPREMPSGRLPVDVATEILETGRIVCSSVGACEMGLR
jgi:hypothetical protein